MYDHEAVDRYLHFVRARHYVFRARQAGFPQEEWTDDPILRQRKFTNVFRVLDHGSQFVVRELLAPGVSSEDALFRSFAYRYTNRPEPFVRFQERFGRYPTLGDLRTGLLAETWRQARADGVPFFGNAYTMFVGAENAGMNRVEWVLGLLKLTFVDRRIHLGFPSTPAEQQGVLVRLPRCADFMAQQIRTDFNYSEHGSVLQENVFVTGGPGSRRGAAILDPRASVVDVIYDMQQELLDGECPRLSGRAPSLMDVQNTL